MTLREAVDIGTCRRTPGRRTGINMRIMRNGGITLTALVCGLLLSVLATTFAAEADDQLWDALAAGGKVVLMRHAPVERNPANGSPLTRDPSCNTELLLSEQGERAAAVVGERFRQRGVPVAKVLHSPYCRTTATAQIAFGDASPAEILSLLEVLGAEQANRQTQELSQVIDRFSGAGNLILVTHEPNINAVSFELMRHLDFLVIDPNGDDGYEELGVVRFSEAE